MQSPVASPFKKPKMTPCFPLLSLPEEMSMYVISFLSAQDMCSISSASRELRKFSIENILWRKLCKQQGWMVPRCNRTSQAEPGFFDFKKYYSEKHALTKPGTLKWGESSKNHGTAPSKRFKHTATVVGKHVIFIGGQETDTKRFNDIIYYDTETRTFNTPTIRGDKVPNFSRHTSCLAGNRIFVFGGFDGFGTNFNLSVFDPFARTWTNVSQSIVRGDVPASRTNHAAAAVGTKMFIFGGNNNNERGAYQVLDDLCMLDTETLTWSRPATTGDRPCARSGHTLTTIGKKVYLFGGGVWNENEGWVHKFNDLYVLDTETMHWTKPVCTGTVDTSTFPIAYNVGRYLFIFGGGSKPQHCVTNDLYVLDTATYRWDMPLVEGNKPQPRDMGIASVVGGKVYFMGGYAGGAVDYWDVLSVGAPSLLCQQL